MHPSRKIILLLAAFSISFFLFSGCSDKNSVSNTDQIVGSGKLVSENRTVAPFTGIQLVGAGDVIITQDSVQSLTVETDDNIVGLLSTTVENGIATSRSMFMPP